MLCCIINFDWIPNDVIDSITEFRFHTFWNVMLKIVTNSNWNTILLLLLSWIYRKKRRIQQIHNCWPLLLTGLMINVAYDYKHVILLIENVSILKIVAHMCGWPFKLIISLHVSEWRIVYLGWKKPLWKKKTTHTFANANDEVSMRAKNEHEMKDEIIWVCFYELKKKEEVNETRE